MINHLVRYVILLLFFGPSPIIAESGVFATVHTGWSDQNYLPVDPISTALSSKKRTFSTIRCGIGYLHDFTPRFGLGVEAARADYGKTMFRFAAGEPISAQITTTEFLGIFIWRHKWMDFLLQVGGVRNSLEARQPLSATQSVTHQQMKVGGGVLVPINRHVALSLQYSHTAGKLHDAGNFARNVPGLRKFLVGLHIAFFDE